MKNYKIKLNDKIKRALYRICEDFPDDDDEIKTPSDLANYMISWYITRMYDNGHDYIDRD